VWEVEVEFHFAGGRFCLCNQISEGCWAGRREAEGKVWDREGKEEWGLQYLMGELEEFAAEAGDSGVDLEGHDGWVEGE